MNIISSCSDLITALRLISIAKSNNREGQPLVQIELSERRIKLSKNSTHFEIERYDNGVFQFNILTKSSKKFKTLTEEDPSPIRACLAEIYFQISQEEYKVDGTLSGILKSFFKDPEITSDLSLYNHRDGVIDKMTKDLPDSLLFHSENGIKATLDLNSDTLSIGMENIQNECLIKNMESHFPLTKELCDHRLMAIQAIVVGLAGHNVRDQNDLMRNSGVLAQKIKTLNPSSSYQNEWF